MSSPNGDLEYVTKEDFFRVLERELPGRTTVSIAEEARISEDRLYKLREQKTISLTVADPIFTNLDLHHLFATGDIPIYSKAEERIIRLEKELAHARKRKVEETERADKWRQRARTAEAQLSHLRSKLAG